MEPERFWKNIEVLAHDNGYDSLKQLCECANISYQRFMFARRKGAYPLFEDIITLSEHLDVDINEIVKGYEPTRHITAYDRRITEALMRADSRHIDAIKVLLGIDD